MASSSNGYALHNVDDDEQTDRDAQWCPRSRKTMTVIFRRHAKNCPVLKVSIHESVTV